MTIENTVSAPSVTITNDVNLIEDQISNIVGSAARYKTNVSAALINSIAHHIEKGGFELVTATIEAVAKANPRDLKVISFFIDKMTPFTLKADSELEKVGGKKSKSKTLIPAIKCRMKANFESTATADEKTKANSADGNAVVRFKKFAGLFTDGKGNKVHGAKVANLAYTPDMAKDQKSIFENFNSDIFAWFDYVTYATKAHEGTTKTKPDDEKRVNAVDSQIGKINELISADYLKDNADVKEKAEALITALMEAVKADREAVDSRKVAKDYADQLAKQVKQLEKVGGDVDGWKAKHAQRVSESKTIENIANEFTPVLEKATKAHEDKKAAEEKAGK